MTCRSGIGTTVGFGTTSYTPQVRTIQGLGIERDEHDCTHMGTSVSSEYPNLVMRDRKPGDIGDNPQITLGILADPDEDVNIPTDEDTETITLTFRKVKVGGTLQTAAATAVFDAYVVSWSYDINYENLIEGELVIRPVGDIVITAGAA